MAEWYFRLVWLVLCRVEIQNRESLHAHGLARLNDDHGFIKLIGSLKRTNVQLIKNFSFLSFDSMNIVPLFEQTVINIYLTIIDIYMGIKDKLGVEQYPDRLVSTINPSLYAKKDTYNNPCMNNVISNNERIQLLNSVQNHRLHEKKYFYKGKDPKKNYVDLASTSL